MNNDTMCQFCKMLVYTRKHHLIPRSKQGKITIDCCETCENYIHRSWNNNELRDIYNTVESILKTNKFQKFLKWRLKQSTATLFKSQPGKFRDKNRYH